jgi:hypothetical protein
LKSHLSQFRSEGQPHIQQRCRQKVHTDSSYTNNLKENEILDEISLSVSGRHSPPPSVNPATPTPGTRPPMTFTPVGSSTTYTWSQVRPAPTSTVPDVKLTFVPLKRDNAICTPLVEENPGLAACPPPFTAKGVRLDPRIRIYENSVEKAGASNQVTLQSRPRPRQSLAPQSKRTSRYLKKQRVKYRTSTQVQLDHPLNQCITNERR